MLDTARCMYRYIPGLGLHPANNSFEPIMKTTLEEGDWFEGISLLPLREKVAIGTEKPETYER